MPSLVLMATPGLPRGRYVRGQSGQGLEGSRVGQAAALWLSLIAQNLRNICLLPKGVGNWSLTSLQQRLAKTGGRLIKHAPYVALRHLSRSVPTIVL
jgi:hypothetical protein